MLRTWRCAALRVCAVTVSGMEYDTKIDCAEYEECGGGNECPRESKPGGELLVSSRNHEAYGHRENDAHMAYRRRVRRGLGSE